MSALRSVLAITVAGAVLAGFAIPVLGLETVRFYIALPVGTSEKGHPVALRVSLTNTSPTSVRVNARLAVNDGQEPPAFRELTVTIRKPSGHTAQFRQDIKIRAAAAKDVVALAPGRSIAKTIDLNRYYTLDERGAYEARATYASTAPGSASGPIVSNTVRFTLH
jgi:hypothetical protein